MMIEVIRKLRSDKACMFFLGDSEGVLKDSSQNKLFNSTYL